MGPKHISYMHMDVKIIEVTYFKSEVRFDLLGCLEAVVVSKAVKKVQAI